MKRSLDEIDFATAVRLLCEGGRDGRLSASLLAPALDVLRSSVRRRFPPGTGIEVEDVVQSALARFLAAAANGQVDCADSTGYLIVTARNAAIDALRRRRPALPLDALAEDELSVESDPAIQAVLEADAFASALAAAAEAGDHLVVRVAATARDAIEAGGRMPSTRRLAEAVGVSHTTIADALRRLRTYFPDDDSGA